MSENVQSVIDFLTTRASNISLTESQLSDLITELKGKINQLSVAVPGTSADAITVLYSGRMPDGTHTGEMAEELVTANPGKVLSINQTEVATLLSSDNAAFHNALQTALGPAGPERDALYNRVLIGNDASGTTRITSDSLWDDASRRFAQNATGTISIIAPEGEAFKIFAQTELPALLDNPNVTHIDGIPREQLIAMRDTKGLAAVQQFTFDNARLKIAISGLSPTNLKDYLDLTPDSYGEALKDVNKYNAVNEMLDGMDEVRKAQFRDSMRTAFYLGEDWAAKGLFKAVNKLGPLGTLAGFLLAANSASAAELNGDSEQAKDIMTEWALDASGSSIGEVVGTTIGGIAIAALATSGVVLSAPLVGAIVIGAALVGGIFGGDGATGLYELLKDKDENDRRNIFEKLSDLLFGGDSTITTPLPADLNGDRLTLDTTFSREEIVSNAKTDIAWRYALRELNPFVIPDISYDRHNADGSLDLYDPATGQGTMTDLYLQDRAAMLTWKIRYDRGLQASDIRTIQGNWDFIDYSIQKGGAPLTLAIDGNGLSLYDHQIVFGSRNADILEGSGDSDHLYGNGGDDILTGNGGNDYLEGGQGNDTYIYHAGDGFDTLLDTDGIGKIQWDSLEIKGSDTIGLDPAQWQQLSNSVWQDQANHLTYTLKTQADGSKTLFINRMGDVLRVDQWVEGNLGITLGAGSAAPPTFTHIYNGDQRAPLNGNTYDWSMTSWVADGMLTGGVIQANFNDVIVGSSETDIINGLGGNDALDGREGNDTLDGGAGNDLIAGGAGSDLIYGGAGNDMILSATGLSVAQRTGPGEIWQVPSGKTVWIQGSNWGVSDAGLYNYSIDGGESLAPDNAPDIIFAGDGDDRVIGGLGDDYMDGGLNNDLLVGHGGNDIIDGGDGDDFIQGDGKVSPGFYETVAGANHGNDILDGGAGADIIIGGGKHDVLFGGIGNDLLWGDETLLPGQFHGNDYLDGGDGDDQLVGGGMDDTLIGGEGRDTLYGDDLATNLAANYHGNDYLDGGDGNDTLFGGGKDDTLFGGFGSDFLWGDANNETALPGQFHGNDYLDGGEGNDQLVGGGGDDILIGGGGNDTLFGDNELTNLAAQFHGNDYLDGGDGDDQLVGGGGDDLLLGGAGSDLLQGENGSDTLEGGDGDDELQGGAGNDVLDGGAGDDLLFGELGDDSFWGGEGSDQIRGGDGNDVLAGDAGDDFLFGQSGDDTLLGGAGADYLSGGSGNDTYVVDNLLDFVDEALNQGTDTIQSSITFTLGANIENLTLTGITAINGTGNALNNVLTGNGAASTLSGGDGDDTYVIGTGDRVDEAAGAGTDTVQSSITYTLTDNVENLTLTGTTAINGTGNALNNVLVGNAAANTLNGGAGVDSMIGGNGDDTYVVDNTLDIVTEALNSGTDTVQSSETYTLSANVENLILTGTTNINGTGNALNNILTGNSAVNTLSGDAGDDTYVIGEGDSVVEAAGAGIDTVQTNLSYTLTDNVENLTLTGTTAINGTGNTLNNVLVGNRADNTLSGGAGVDTLIGGAGDDTYIVDNTSDVVIESPGEGSDQISSSVTYTLSANVENLTLTGTAAINGTGNELDNSLTGNAAGNILDGGLGNDILNGGPGADRLIGGLGSDSLYGGEGDDILYGLYEPVSGRDESSVLTQTAYRYLYESGSALVDGLGETDLGDLAGFGENYLGRNDDGSSGPIDITPVFGPEGLNFFGQRYTHLFVNNNGNITFNSALRAYTPSQVGTGSDPIIAPFWADVDTRANGGVTTPGGNSKGTNLTYYDLDPVNGVLTVTWDDVGYYEYGMDKLNAMQLQVINRGAGDFDLIFRYEAVNWTSGNASGGGMSGLGGTVARAGYSAGDGDPLHYYELPESGNQEQMLALDTTPGNSARTGVYIFHVRNGNPIADNQNAIRNGDTGVNLLYGGAGNDIYVVDNPGDIVVELVDEGMDQVKASVSYVLPDQVENLTLTGTANIDGSGNALDNVLIGNSAANTLSGGLGTDTLIGGAGDDTYIVDNTLDIVSEALNEGIDLVQSSITYTLTGNVENLTLIGTKAINGTGNALNNVLTGNSAANILTGGAGNDTYVIGSGDKVVEAVGEGNDTIQSSVTYLLGVNVENLTLTGMTAINGTGNELDNVLTGNSAANTLSGGTGADTMMGGAGNDTYVIDNTLDVIIENLNEGTDLVKSSVTYILAANVENLILTGTAAINGTGNELNNSLTGNAAANNLSGGLGNDILNGGLGADSMIGGLGDDSYYIDNAGDTVLENAGEGNDIVYSSIAYTLGANLERLYLTGTAAISAIGQRAEQHPVWLCQQCRQHTQRQSRQ